MANFNQLSVVLRLVQRLSLLGLLIVLFSCKNEGMETDKGEAVVGVESPETVIWHIKAVHPEGSLLDVKAIDKDDNKHDVKALQYSEGYAAGRP